MTNDGKWNQKVNSMIITLVITSLSILMLSASPSVQAQAPTAQVSLECSPGDVHLNSYPGAENSSKNVTCIMGNPTSQEEKIELTGTADGLPLEFVEGQIFVIPPGESREVNVTVSSTEGAHNSVRTLTITAEVTEMNGIPPANAATDSVNILVTINPFDSYVAAYDSPLSFTVVLSNQSQNSGDSIRVTNNGNYDAAISANLEALSDVLGTHNLSISNPVVWNIIAVDGNSPIQLGVGITEDATLNTSSWETLQNGSKRLNLSSSIGFESQLENSTCYQCTQMLDVTLEIFVVESLIDEEPEPQYESTFSLDIPVEAEVMEVDFFFINGTILTSTHDETYIEVAFENSSFEASSVEKYDLRLIHQWNRSDGLSIQNNFSLGLSVESLRGNITMAYNVHVRAFILDDDLQQIFTDEDSFEIVVPYLDTDGDGIADDFDAFPGDPSETLDSDGDGVGDNSDVFPNDPSLWEEVDDEGGNLNETVPGFESWLLLFALLLAARFQRKFAC